MKTKLTKQTVISLIGAIIYSFSVLKNLTALGSGDIFSIFRLVSCILFAVSFYLIFYILHTGGKFKAHIPTIFSLASAAEICSLVTLSNSFANAKLAFFVKVAVVIISLLILLASVLKKYDLALKLLFAKIVAGSALYIIIFYHNDSNTEPYLHLILTLLFIVTSASLVVGQILEALPFIYLIKNEKAEQENDIVDLE